VSSWSETARNSFGPPHSIEREAGQIQRRRWALNQLEREFVNVVA